MILASASPCRKKLLKKIIPDFITIPSNANENLRSYLPLKERVVTLALDKVMLCHQYCRELEQKGEQAGKERYILGADTLIYCPAKRIPSRILGKPKDEIEARSMLECLSASKHWVFTGLALLDRHTFKILQRCSKTQVIFSTLSSQLIQMQLKSGEWIGAAGAYRAQGIAGSFIKRIKGTASCIEGLPLNDVYEMLDAVMYFKKDNIA